ncbi:hypothetical protein TSMEX_011061 [Taenia solium]|eukprot:TsM_001044200 transcript=TsM_001044200 gene=TsM_001044200
MSRNTQPSDSRGRRRDEEEREETSTVVAALADLSYFKEGIKFEDWMETFRFNIHLYPRWQRVPLILRALPQELFLTEINAGVPADSDIDHCCEMLTELAID